LESQTIFAEAAKPLIIIIQINGIAGSNTNHFGRLNCKNHLALVGVKYKLPNVTANVTVVMITHEFIILIT
jgi:hypothetical protein